MAKPSRPPRMFERGIFCALIGAAVLLAPRFLERPDLREMVGGASVVGWFAIVLGLALVAVDLVKRSKSRE